MRWGIVYFNREYAESLIEQAFTHDEILIRNAIERLRVEEDNGATPYRATLSLVQQVIEDDISANPNEAAAYQVFFLSDGLPVPEISLSEARQRVSAITAINPAKIFLSTAFYGGDTRGKVYLEHMAIEGNGRFINFEATGVLSYRQLIAPDLIK